MKKNELIQQFRQYFPGNNNKIRVFFAPGRVNLIGEHTDYNNGYVLPAALSKGTLLIIQKRDDNLCELKSTNFPDLPVSFTIEDLQFKAEDEWGNYTKGILYEFSQFQKLSGGYNILYSGDIPNGAGLSSSASLGMVTAFAMAEMLDMNIGIKDLALLCQRMENNFIGVQTGIMDQFAVGLGKKDHAIFLDCGTGEVESVSLSLSPYKLVITNTNKRRGLTDSKYNDRRKECEEGLAFFQRIDPSLTSLTDVSLQQWHEAGEGLPPTIKKRVKHIIEENNRVLQAVMALKKGDLITLGQLMLSSHESLRNDYEVTGEHLDALHDAQKSQPGCIGTRMTGAGFGGCTVSLVENGALENFMNKAGKTYFDQTGIEASFYICETGDGVKELGQEVNEEAGS